MTQVCQWSDLGSVTGAGIYRTPNGLLVDVTPEKFTAYTEGSKASGNTNPTLELHSSDANQDAQPLYHIRMFRK